MESKGNACRLDERSRRGLMGILASLGASDRFSICLHLISLRNLKLETTPGEEHHRAVLPPSTKYDAPVMNEALSDARNMMVWAISSGLPTRLSGTVAAKLAFLSAVPVKRFSIPLSIGPGSTMLTRTPDAAASIAADLVSPSTACLLAADMAAPPAPGC